MKHLITVQCIQMGMMQMCKYKVAEKFVSINGEGTHAGQLAVFIRFCGCNLNCSFCDTTWVNRSDTQYTLMSKEEIVKYIEETGVKNVTLTGGEPLIQDNIKELISDITIKGIYTEIETNGSIDIRDFIDINPRPSFTLDYKLPGSGMEENMNVDNFSYVTLNDTVKFVAGDIKDLERFKDVIHKYKLVDKCNVYLSPVYGKISLEMMVDFMKKNCLNGVNLQLQMHKIIWDPNKRGV